MNKVIIRTEHTKYNELEVGQVFQCVDTEDYTDGYLMVISEYNVDYGDDDNEMPKAINHLAVELENGRTWIMNNDTPVRKCDCDFTIKESK